VFGVWPSSDPRAAVIWEAFRPESEPRRTVRRDEAAPEARAAPRRAPRRAAARPERQDDDFLQREEGIY
jgi:penicillin-binding protein 1A